MPLPVNGSSPDETVSSPSAVVGSAFREVAFGDVASGVDVVGGVVGVSAAGITVNVRVWSGSVRSFAALIVTV